MSKQSNIHLDDMRVQCSACCAEAAPTAEGECGRCGESVLAYLDDELVLVGTGLALSYPCTVCGWAETCGDPAGEDCHS